MILPQIGELKWRVKLRVLESVPDRHGGFSKKTLVKDEMWGKLETVGAGIYFGTKQVDSTVTHRVYVRRYDGRTRPQDLAGVVECEIDGQIYRVRRIADAGGERRFTVLDCEEKGDAVRSASRPKLSDFRL